jgi:polyketide biosynthesis acyl carrier protein
MRTTEDPKLNAIVAIIRASAVEIVPEIDPDDVQPHHSLAELGCNSIDRADIMAMTMEELGVAVPITELADLRDVGALAQVLRRHLP